MTGDLVPHDEAERDREARFNTEPTVWRRYDNVALREVVLDLIREYGAPNDLSAGIIDPPTLPVTAYWEGRSLRAALDDLATRYALRWQRDGDQRLHVVGWRGPRMKVGTSERWMPVYGVSISYTTGTGTHAAPYVQRPTNLGANTNAIFGNVHVFVDLEGNGDGTPE